MTTTFQPSFFFDLLRFFFRPLLGKKEGKSLSVWKIREKEEGDDDSDDDDVFSRRLRRFASSSFEQLLSFSLSAAMVLTNDDEM